MNDFLKFAGYALDPSNNVWCRVGYGGIAYSDGDETEQRIATVIRDASDITVLSAELRLHCTDWPSLYHLSGTRANILRPLQESLSGNILEIGAGCGAITRYLGECGANVLALEGSPRRAAIARSRSRDLTNVTVLAEKFDQFECDQQFDVITLIGVLEYANLFTPGDKPALSMLERVRSFLKPDGRLIIAIENQLGLKYLAGAPEDHIGLPMYGIEGRYQKNQPQTFGRQVLQTLLNKSGFSHSVFMAPFPDYKLPASIVTETGFLDPKFDAAAFAWQSVRRDPQLPPIMSFSQELVWPLVTSNGLAIDLANSFLIVASGNPVSELNRDALAYHYSTDRLPQYCKETIFLRKKVAGDVKVTCRLLSKSDATQTQDAILFRPESYSDYSLGFPLSWEFIKIVSRDGWHMNEVVDYFKRFLVILSDLTNTDDSRIDVFADDSKSCVHGQFIDAIPQNILCLPNNVFRLIDTEWQAREDISTARLLFRSMLWPMFSLTRFGQPAEQPNDSFTRKDFIFELFSRLGLRDELNNNFSTFIHEESLFQEIVTGKSVQQFMDWWPTELIPLENLNIAVPKREERIQVLHQTVAHRDQKINELEQNIKERNDLIKSINEIVVNRDERIRELTRLQTEKEEQISNLNQAISERDGRIEYMSSALTETLNSTSWLISSPIRLVGSLVARLRNGVHRRVSLIAARPYSILTHEPIWRFCKIAGNTALKVRIIAPWVHRIRDHIRRQMLPTGSALIPHDGGRDNLDAYLPSKSPTWRLPKAVLVTVIIPVYRGLDETKRCLNSVLMHRGQLSMDVLVVDDCSPEPQISSWLETVATAGQIRLLKNESNRGFVASVNLGMSQANSQDVVLLNSDTEVPANWLDRLVGHAYSNEKVGSVTPFSNNATICSWPSMEGGELPTGVSLETIDKACYAANCGRQIELPTAVGFCMYIRRDCLEAVGPFDEAAFGKGYGEENDFCMRATALGWKHLLACDTFVYHAGETSFGKNSPHRAAAWEILTRRHPDYPATVARHVQADAAAPARLAAAAALFKATSKPVILLVTHALGGGTDRHIHDLTSTIGERANFLRLEPAQGGVRLSAPLLPGLPTIVFQSTDVSLLTELLQSFGVNRIHVHHWIGLEMDLRYLIDSLGVPFDLTVHDYYSVCPRINLMRSPDSGYCGEPGPSDCNACIAARFAPGLTDITDWRNRNAWLFYEAQRVICPSEDTKRRIGRYFPQAKLMAIPHQPVKENLWHVAAPQFQENERMRIAILGVVAKHKGLDALIAAATVNPSRYEFIVIGYCDPPLPRELRQVISETGRYEGGELATLLAKAQPHAVWFPAYCPETYSFTLSTAIEAGLPIIASALGAFPERLKGRPLTWEFQTTSDLSELGELLETVCSTLTRQSGENVEGSRQTMPSNFYETDYLISQQPVETPCEQNLYSLKQKGHTSVLVLPDRRSDGAVSPCGSIRLVQPFDLLGSVSRDLMFEQVDAKSVFHRIADILVCQRHVFSNLADADRLIEHCHKHRIRLVYDLDDDLVNIPDNHPEVNHLRKLAPVVIKLLRAADVVWVATPALARRITEIRSDAIIVPNALDDRIWKTVKDGRTENKIRILYMGTATHDEELTFLAPVALELSQRYGNRVRFEVVGVTTKILPTGFDRRLPDTDLANLSYPGFVEWFVRQKWDIAVSPLIDGTFNQCKSAIKLMDYAAIRVPVVASKHSEYEAAFGDNEGVVLLENEPAIWIETLGDLIERSERRLELGYIAWQHYNEKHTLTKHLELRKTKLFEVLKSESIQARH